MALSLLLTIYPYPFILLFSLSMRNPKYFTIVKHWRYLTLPWQILRFSSLTDFSSSIGQEMQVLEDIKTHLVTSINQILRTPFPPSLEWHVCASSHGPFPHLPSAAFLSLYTPIIRTTISSEPSNTSQHGSSLNKDFFKRQCLNMTNDISPVFGRVTARAGPDIYSMLYKTTNIFLNPMGCHVTQNICN